MKICSYIMNTDSGLAPNPFWGFCTLALCTPNHQGVKLSPNDWIIGTRPRSLGGKLIYAMKISEKIHFQNYFNDKRFQKKKPNLSGSWKDKCGDNIYSLDGNDQWKQLPVLYHNTHKQVLQDTKYPYAYVSKHFYYFGENAIEIPDKFSELIRDRHGCKCNHQPAVMAKFVDWIEEKLPIGVQGLPADRHYFIEPLDESICSPCRYMKKSKSVKEEETNKIKNPC